METAQAHAGKLVEGAREMIKDPFSPLPEQGGLWSTQAALPISTEREVPWLKVCCNLQQPPSDRYLLKDFFPGKSGSSTNELCNLRVVT